MTDWSDMIGGAAKGAAAGAMLGPVGAGVGGLIGLASSLVPHVFGADAQTALSAVAEAITGTGDEGQQVAVLSSDPAAIAQFKVQALKIAADREQAQLDAQSNDIAARLGDVANARQQTVTLAQNGSALAWGSAVVSIVVVVGFFVAFGLLIYGPVPTDNGQQAMLNILTGALAAGFAAVLGYWLGSSISSRGKDVTIAAMAAQSPLVKQPAPTVNIAQNN